MFEDIRNLVTENMNSFNESVRDEFGMSILRDVFEPMLSEITGLIQMCEYMESTVKEIDQLTQELQAIEKNAYEY